MRIGDALAQELEIEARSTHRVVECVPAAQLTWRPHAKSMTLGQLAMHVAGLPGVITRMAAVPVFDATNVSFTPPQPAVAADLLPALSESVTNAAKYLRGLDDAAAAEPWAMQAGGKTLLTLPRAAMLRTLLFNHWYHHRGQLTVYLRLQDVQLPSVYGPTADERGAL